jgi:DNA-binding HxlR family transcriptional regulator
MVTKENNLIVLDENNPLKCPITRTHFIIGGKWKIVILYYLRKGPLRFGEIDARIPAISRKILTDQLRDLVLSGLVSRQPFSEIPPRVEYQLTEMGQSLMPVFEEMYKWGMNEGKKVEQRLRRLQ